MRQRNLKQTVNRAIILSRQTTVAIIDFGAIAIALYAQRRGSEAPEWSEVLMQEPRLDVGPRWPKKMQIDIEINYL